MDADDVGLGQQLLEGAHPPGVAVGQPVGGVVEGDPHTDGLSHVRELRADVAVADDAQGAAADLVAPPGRLVPDAVVHPLRLLGQAAGQRHNLAQHQLDDTAGVGERRVEDGDPARGRVDEVHLVGADAEAAHREEVLSRVQGTGRHLGVRPDAEQRHAGQGVDQLASLSDPARVSTSNPSRRKASVAIGWMSPTTELSQQQPSTRPHGPPARRLSRDLGGRVCRCPALSVRSHRESPTVALGAEPKRAALAWGAGVRRRQKCVSGGGLEPPRPLRALAPQASASAIPPPGLGGLTGPGRSPSARRNGSTQALRTTNTTSSDPSRPTATALFRPAGAALGRGRRPSRPRTVPA